MTIEQWAQENGAAAIAAAQERTADHSELEAMTRERNELAHRCEELVDALGQERAQRAEEHAAAQKHLSDAQRSCADLRHDLAGAQRNLASAQRELARFEAAQSGADLVAAEREACAAQAGVWDGDCCDRCDCGDSIAAAIRARGGA